MDGQGGFPHHLIRPNNIPQNSFSGSSVFPSPGMSLFPSQMTPGMMHQSFNHQHSRVSAGVMSAPPAQKAPEDPIESARKRQFLEQQKKMKDFSALTKTQIDADTYAKSLFGPSEPSDQSKQGSSVSIPLPKQATPPSVSVPTFSTAHPSPTSKPSSATQSQPSISIAPVQKSLEETMLSMCDLSTNTKQQTSKTVTNKSRDKELRSQHNLPLWLMDENMSSLPPLYQQNLQYVCADSPDHLPIRQKVLSVFSSFGIDYARCSSIMMLTQRTLPNGQLTKREFVEALALIILTRQGVRFSGVDFLLTLSSPPLLPQVMASQPLSNMHTGGPIEFSSQMLAQPSVSAPLAASSLLPESTKKGSDFEEDDFQSFQSVTKPHSPLKNTYADISLEPLSFSAKPAGTTVDTMSGADKYAAFRELESDAPTVTASHLDADSVAERSSTSIEVGNSASLVSNMASNPKNEEDDWAEFSAVSFQKQDIMTKSLSIPPQRSQVSYESPNPFMGNLSPPPAQHGSLQTDSSSEDIWCNDSLTNAAPIKADVTLPPQGITLISPPHPNPPAESALPRISPPIMPAEFSMNVDHKAQIPSKPNYSIGNDAFSDSPAVAAFEDEPPTPPPLIVSEENSPQKRSYGADNINLFPYQESIGFEETMKTSNFKDFRSNNDQVAVTNPPIAADDLDFFASLETPASTVITRNESNNYLDTFPNIRALKAENCIETGSVSSLDLGKVPSANDTPAIKLQSANSPLPFDVVSPIGTLTLPIHSDNRLKNEADDEDFGDFSRADSLSLGATNQREIPSTVGGGLADFQTMSFDSFATNSAQSSTVSKNTLSLFDDDIPESSPVPPTFNKLAAMTPLGSSAPIVATSSTKSNVFRLCVQAACDIVQQSVTTFQNAKGGEETVMEAMCTKRGRSFIASIREVREIVRRLKTALPNSMPTGDLSIGQILETFVHFETLWSTLIDLLPQHIADILVKQNHDNCSTPLETPLSPSNGAACELCWGSFSGANNTGSPMTAVTLSSGKYHAVCANFWEHCVSSKSSAEVPAIR